MFFLLVHFLHLLPGTSLSPRLPCDCATASKTTVTSRNAYVHQSTRVDNITRRKLIKYGWKMSGDLHRIAIMSSIWKRTKIIMPFDIANKPLNLQNIFCQGMQIVICFYKYRNLAQMNNIWIYTKIMTLVFRRVCMCSLNYVACICWWSKPLALCQFVPGWGNLCLWRATHHTTPIHCKIHLDSVWQIRR